MTATADEPHVGFVVEGRGELGAVPVLARKWLQAQGEYRDILGKPVPVHGRDKAIKPDGLEGYVATAAGRPGCVGVLVVLDAETDAACELGPELLSRGQEITGKPVAVCLAEPKYEAWLVASAETLELDGLSFPSGGDPVGVIKNALSTKYIKPTWQPRLTARIDFSVACPRAASLSRFCAKLDELRSGL